MSPLALLAVLALSGGVSALGVATSRQPRWFLRVGTVTQTMTERVVVTQVTPSSCVEVAPSLAPCMHLPHEISPSPTTSIETTKNLEGGRAFWDGWLASSKNQPDDVLVAPTPPVSDADADDASTGGWKFNHLFDGLYSTVTSTVVEQATARIDDLDHVITFSVVGCLPTQLPFNLPLCHPGDGVGVGVGVAVEAAASQGVVTQAAPPVVGPDPRSVA